MLGDAKLDLAPGPPTAAFLSLAMLGFVFAASVGPQKFAGVEPVDSLGSPQHGRQDTAKFVILRTAMPPEGSLCRCFTEAHQFLDAAVAIRRDDEHRTWQLILRVDFEEQVMMKLSLLPVVENFVASEPASHVFQERPEPKILRQLFYDHPPILPHLGASAGGPATARLHAFDGRC
jgi:hypothetical protein